MASRKASKTKKPKNVELKDQKELSSVISAILNTLNPVSLMPPHQTVFPTVNLSVRNIYNHGCNRVFVLNHYPTFILSNVVIRQRSERIYVYFDENDCKGLVDYFDSVTTQVSKYSSSTTTVRFSIKTDKYTEKECVQCQIKGSIENSTVPRTVKIAIYTVYQCTPLSYIYPCLIITGTSMI